MYEIRLAKQAEKDLQNVLRSPLKKQLAAILAIIEKDPYQPPYEKLNGKLENTYSRRLNIQHRLIYEIYEEEKIIKILRMWTHYGDN